MTKYRNIANNGALVIVLLALVACAVSVYMFRSASLCDFEKDWFSDNTKRELFPNILLWRTSGRDVALTDREGWGLVPGNVVGYRQSGRHNWLFAVVVESGNTNIVSLSTTEDGAVSLNSMTNTISDSFNDIGALL